MADVEKKIGKSSMDDEFKIPLVWAGENCDLTREQNAVERLEQKRRRILAIKEYRGENCDLTREQNAVERREQKRRRILAIKEYRANNPRPRNKSNKVTHFRVPVTVTYSDYLPYGTIPPEGRPVFPAGAKVLSKDLGVSSEENQKIYQSPVTEASAILQD